MACKKLHIATLFKFKAVFPHRRENNCSCNQQVMKHTTETKNPAPPTSQESPEDQLLQFTHLTAPDPDFCFQAKPSLYSIALLLPCTVK